ncbi:MAG: GntR family transcriptional regulator [Pseudoflavonifractor sp.]
MSDQKALSAEMQAYYNLKQAIFERRLAPGAALTERSLCEFLQLGRTPVRAALKHLTADGFVTIIPNRGAFLISATRKQMEQCYEVKNDMLMSIIRKHIQEFTETEFSLMEEAIAAESAAFNNFQFQQYLDSIWAFFAVIIAKAENPLLDELYEIVCKRIGIYLVLYDDFYMPQRHRFHSGQGHRDILNALRQRDIVQIETLMNTLAHTVVNNLQFAYTAAANIDSAFH